MAIIEREDPLELEAGEVEKTAERPLGALTRPQGSTGWKSWLFTVDHKKIGIMYGAALPPTISVLFSWRIRLNR